MVRFLASAVVLAVLVLPTISFGAHPDRNSVCLECHTLGSDKNAPAVVVEGAGLIGGLMGGKELRGHASVSCVGDSAGGQITGCHNPGNGIEDFLVMDVSKAPVDEFCKNCHADQAKLGNHHPSYKSDKDKDGVAETMVVPQSDQPVLSEFSPAGVGGILAKYPDALVIDLLPNGEKQLVATIPLEKVVEMVDGKEVTTENVITCSSCHNPHFGYLTAVKGIEELNPQLVARTKGDALLRMRDFDNALCETCH